VPEGRFRLLIGHELQDEDSYDLMRSSFSPRLEWRRDDRLTAYVFYRLEYDQLDDVPLAVRLALPFGAPRETILSGGGVGVDAVFADDPIDPTRGVVFAASVEGVGLGGDVHLVRALTETSLYHPLGVAKLFGAARLRLGLVNPIGGDDEVPLFERFYSGGSNSVRGYERRHVGPLADGDPIGGRSLAEMSVEIRRVIVGDLGGAVFVDAGALGLEGDRFALGDVQVGTGAGLRYRSARRADPRRPRLSARPGRAATRRGRCTSASGGPSDANRALAAGRRAHRRGPRWHRVHGRGSLAIKPSARSRRRSAGTCRSKACPV
jgi:outer membrane protein assembly factor BamA